MWYRYIKSDDRKKDGKHLVFAVPLAEELLARYVSCLSCCAIPQNSCDRAKILETPLRPALGGNTLEEPGGPWDACGLARLLAALRAGCHDEDNGTMARGGPRRARRPYVRRSAEANDMADERRRGPES